MVIFISDCLRNLNTVEFLGIWEGVYNSSFNYGMTTFYSEKRSQKIQKINKKEILLTEVLKMIQFIGKNKITENKDKNRSFF